MNGRTGTAEDSSVAASLGHEFPECRLLTRLHNNANPDELRLIFDGGVDLGGGRRNKEDEQEALAEILLEVIRHRRPGILRDRNQVDDLLTTIRNWTP